MIRVGADALEVAVWMAYDRLAHAHLQQDEVWVGAERLVIRTLTRDRRRRRFFRDDPRLVLLEATRRKEVLAAVAALQARARRRRLWVVSVLWVVALAAVLLGYVLTDEVLWTLLSVTSLVALVAGWVRRGSVFASKKDGERADRLEEEA